MVREDWQSQSSLLDDKNCKKEFASNAGLQNLLALSRKSCFQLHIPRTDNLLMPTTSNNRSQTRYQLRQPPGRVWTRIYVIDYDQTFGIDVYVVLQIFCHNMPDQALHPLSSRFAARLVHVNRKSSYSPFNRCQEIHFRQIESRLSFSEVEHSLPSS